MIATLRNVTSLQGKKESSDKSRKRTQTAQDPRAAELWESESLEDFTLIRRDPEDQWERSLIDADWAALVQLIFCELQTEDLTKMAEIVRGMLTPRERKLELDARFVVEESRGVVEKRRKPGRPIWSICG